MNRNDIKHRFANRLEGKNGSIRAGNVSYEGRCYYSYYTVFGQWLDMKKNVVAIFDGSTSNSSNKHKLYSEVFPGDVHVFPLDLGDGSSWSHCNLIGKYANKDSDFKFDHRMVMINHYVGRIYDQLAAINGGKCKGLENVDFSAWGYVEKLCSLYKDTTIKKYINWLPRHEHYADLAVRLNEGERDVETLVDYLFGVGTYRAYMDRAERFRKADRIRQQTTELAHRLGIGSPYESEWGTEYMPTELKAQDIRKMTAKERLDIHFKALAYKEQEEHEKERREKYNENFRNAYKWIVGTEPQKSWNGYDNSVNGCVNKNNGEQYVWGTRHIFGFYYWLDLDVSFDYDNYRTSPDKEQWIEDFYAKCKEVRDNRHAIAILRRIKAHTKEKKHSWDDDAYINDDYLRENTTEEEFNLCAEFIRKQDKHYADEEARARAAEIARLKREEEERKEREYREKVKQEQIDECLANGLEGRRDLWRKHLMEINDAESYNDSRDDSEFFFGGNVLLRLNLNKDMVETSKYIRIPVEVCKKMWKIVEKWHENPSCFKSVEIDTKGSGKYTISSYENDILTAGCHKIAYCEMERVMNETNNIN